MTRNMVMVAAALAAGVAAAAALEVDFTKDVGKIRPELHSSGFGPTICSQTAQDLADVKAMGFKAARTHDWALVNANQRVCDYFHVFPLMHLDAKDPKNYVFGPTDYLLKRTREEAGLDIFYRLGTSIEHSGKKVHFNALIPEDFDKVAEIFAGTVRHYNRGWADGFRWNIRYWEIWNEPDGIENMWFPKEGIEGLADEALDAKRAVCRAEFATFFVKVLKRLKDEFGDEIKVGGPALVGYNETWLREILGACRAAGVAPDFVSWHGYRSNPMAFNQDGERCRALLDSYGFAKCEMIVNEWHYFGYDDYSWDDMQRCSDPAVKARVWTGPRSHNGSYSAGFALTVLANLQRSKIAQAYYYGCSHVGAWGFKDAYQKKFKVFYALKMFGDFVKANETMCASTSEGPLTTLAGRSANGRKELLFVFHGGTNTACSVSVKGATAVKSCTVLDETRDLEPQSVPFKDGVLTLEKRDGNDAAFLVTFE